MMLRACLLLCVGLLTAVPATSAQESARDVVDRTVQKVLAILKQDGNIEVRRERIEKIVYAHFDFGTMGKLVLARNWRKLSPEQKQRFIEEFKRHLSRTYGKRLERYKQEEVEITGERPEPRGDVTVTTRIVGGQFDGTEVDYRMRKREGEWRVIDVIIEGVSLVANFRSQFKDVIARDGAQGLIDQLAERNRAARQERDDADPPSDEDAGASP